ncbi:MAG: phosphoribosylanthranilate isomerase [Sporomusaceae bacterium]|nr:phosphoribosylanthranilate isomerase [Sporomusaceae bacterium]
MRIKICGLRDPAAAVAAAAAGADAIGLVFAVGKRQVTPAIAREICRELPPFVNKVGVFVDADPLEVEEIAGQCGLDTLQFHGRESPAYCSRFSRTVIKALAVKDAASLARIGEYGAFTLLLDSYVAGLQGGSGRSFPWQLAVGAAAVRPIVLAGGLHAGNVLAAIAAVRPAGVDVSSGVETDGVKDIKKIREFITTIRRWQYDD